MALHSSRPPQPLPGFAAKHAPPGGRLSGSTTPARSTKTNWQGFGCNSRQRTPARLESPSWHLPPTPHNAVQAGLTQLLCSLYLKPIEKGGEVVASICNLSSQCVQLLVPLSTLPPAPKLAFKLAEGIQLRIQCLG